MHNHDEHEHHHDTKITDIPSDHMAICPVTGDAIDTVEAEKIGHFRDYNGKRIYFCCATCVQLFDENPEKYAPTLHQCLECGLHYASQDTARECEAWCKEHKSCSLEITKQSVESQQGNKQVASLQKTTALRLLEKKHLVDNIWAFRFTPDQPLSWTPGQFIRVEITHDNPDSEGTKRWFTISSTPHDGFIQITTRITDTTFKQALAALETGQTIKLIEQPDGDFVWQESDKPLVLVAGGIGITPFYSMLKARGHSGQPVSATLIYNGRTDELPFKAEFEEASQRHPEFTVHYVIGEPLTAKRLAELVPDINASQVYISGPESMVEALGKQLEENGITNDNLHQDFFPHYSEANY